MRVREFDVRRGGGEGVVVTVFLVPAQELKVDEDNDGEEPVLGGLGRAGTKAQAGQSQNVVSTSASSTSSTLSLSRTDSSFTCLTTLTSSTPSSSTLDTTAAQALRSEEARSWDYDHPGYVGCVGTCGFPDVGATVWNTL